MVMNIIVMSELYVYMNSGIYLGPIDLHECNAMQQNAQ
jgi:hypothetical protein